MATEIKGDSGWNTDFATAIAYIVDEKAAAVGGGTSTAGSFQTRVLNTIRYDTQSIVTSLTSNEFTLEAGTYLIDWRSPLFEAARHTSRLYNVTDATVAETGASAYSENAVDQSDSIGFAVVTIASAKAFRIEYYAETAQASNGLGVETNAAGQVNTYTAVKIQKVKS